MLEKKKEKKKLSCLTRRHTDTDPFLGISIRRGASLQ